MLIEFDQTTIANMTAALDSVCKRIPPHKDGYEARRQIADAMIASARSGKRTLSDLEEVGANILVELMPPKFGWFGLRRLFG